MKQYTQIILAILLTSVAFFSSADNGKDGYHIEIKVNNMPDDTVQLGFYYADKRLLKTKAAAKNSRVVFEGEEKLPGGIYMVIVPGNKYFEIMLDDDQHFKMETDTTGFIKHMKVTGSEENERFYDYLQNSTPMQKEARNLSKKLEELEKDSKEYKRVQKELEEANEELKKYKLEFVKKYPEALLSKVFLASKSPEIPEDTPESKEDSLFAYKYYKKHFFDNIDFDDERLLRTPVFWTKIEEYLDKVVHKDPDSLIKAAHYIIGKAEGNKEVFKFLVQKLTTKYEVEAHKVMGLDAVFVDLVNKYYKTGKAFWVDSMVLKKIVDRANTLEPLLLFSKTPELKMYRFTMDIPDKDSLIGMYYMAQRPPKYSLHAVDANYTLLAFWDPTCGHCKKVMPKMYDFVEENKDSLGLKVYSVITIIDTKDIKKYIKDNLEGWDHHWDPFNHTNFRDVYDINSTPVIYLLDKDKKIIGKRISVKDIKPLIEMDKKRKAKVR